jgi:hypothetical protein
MFVDFWIARALHPYILPFAISVDPRVFQSELKIMRPFAFQHILPVVLDILQILIRDKIQPLKLVVGGMCETHEFVKLVVDKLHPCWTSQPPKAFSVLHSPVPGTKMYIAVGESSANLANFISDNLTCSSASSCVWAAFCAFL